MKRRKRKRARSRATLFPPPRGGGSVEAKPTISL